MRTSVAVAGPKSRRAITSSGNESTKTLIAKASSANAERGAGQRDVAPTAALEATAVPHTRRAQHLDTVSTAPTRARAVRVRAQADGRAGARDRLAQQLHELGIDAHVRAVDLERRVGGRGELGQPVEPLREVGRALGAG